MINFSYTFKKKKFSYKLPTTYTEITIGQLIRFSEHLEKGTDDLYVLHELSGIPYQHLERMPIELIQQIDSILSIIWDSPIENTPEFKIGKFTLTHYNDYGEMIIGQFEDFKTYAQGKGIFEVIPYLMAFLTDGPEYDYKQRTELMEEILLLPASFGIYHQNLFAQKYDRIQKRFVFLFTKEETKDSELLTEAGGGTLDQFGFYGNAIDMAGGDLFKLKKILTELTVNEVYYYLTYAKTKEQVSKNYIELKRGELRTGTKED